MGVQDRLSAALADSYEIIREIGRGGMSVVFLARDRKHDRDVALKALRPEFTATLGAERFQREIVIASHLDHIHLLPLFDSGMADEVLYFVMPYVSGGSLRDRLNTEGPLALEEVTRIVSEVADGLAYANRLGIVHRDIKPENVLFVDEHAVVADFGIAHAYQSAGGETVTEQGVAIGTPDYMSPEQAAGEPHIDLRSDVYSLACVAYEMLAGGPPFEGPTTKSVLAKHMHERVPSLSVVRPGIPAAMVRVVEKALAKTPADRYPTAEAFAEALEAARAAPTRRRVVDFRLWRVAAVAALVGVAGYIGIQSLASRAPLPAGRLPILVAPFVGDTSESSSGAALHRRLQGYLRLFTNVDPRDASDLGDAGTMVLAEDELVELARAERMGYAVAGELSRAPDRTTLFVSVYDVHTRERAVQLVSQPGESVDRALSRLTLEAVAIMAERDGVDIGIQRDALSSTWSAEAAGLAVEARRLLVSGDADAAAEALDRAIDIDSTFLLAYHRRAVAEEWRHRWPRSAAEFALNGLARAGEASSRWKDLLEAQRYFSLSIADSATAAFNLIRLDHPDDEDAWLGYGETLYHFGPFLGFSPQGARGAFDRLTELGTTYPTIYSHLVDLALRRGDLPTATHYLDRVGEAVGEAPALRLMLFASQRPTSREMVLDSLRGSQRGTVSRIVRHFAMEMQELEFADSVAGVLLDAARTPEDRTRGAQYRLVLGAAAGRWDEVVATWSETVGDLSFDPWVVLAYLAGFPAEAWAAPMVERARDDVRQGRAPNFALAQYDPLRSGFRSLVQWVTLYGDSVEASWLLGRIEARRATQTVSDPLPWSLGLSLEGRLALLAGDTAGAMAKFEAAVTRPVWHLLGYYPSMSMAPQRDLLARLCAARNDTDCETRWRTSLRESGALGDLFYW